jgi:hypothetical protein
LATKDRAALVARTAAGDVVPATESRANQEALTDTEGNVGLLRDALPGAEAEVTRAEAAVTRVLRAEAQRLEASAIKVHEAAKEALAAAQGREQRAASALEAARRRSASAGNRGFWAGRASAAPTDGEDDDIMTPEGWDRFVKDQAARASGTVDQVRQRHAIADEMIAEHRRRGNAG